METFVSLADSPVCVLVSILGRGMRTERLLGGQCLARDLLSWIWEPLEMKPGSLVPVSGTLWGKHADTIDT